MGIAQRMEEGELRGRLEALQGSCVVRWRESEFSFCSPACQSLLSPDPSCPEGGSWLWSALSRHLRLLQTSSSNTVHYNLMKKYKKSLNFSICNFFTYC